MAAPQRELESQFSFEKADRLLKQKRTDSQFHKIVSITLKANLCSHLPEKIGFIQWKASGDLLKIQKPPAKLNYLCLHQYI
jgi:hypothetical protein